jgi:hypothetical protein
VSHNNRSGEKGTAAEVAVVRCLRECGWPAAERRRLAGRQDRGDIAGIPGVVIEVKNCRAMDLAGWVTEAQREALGPVYAPGGLVPQAELAIVWHKRPGKGDPLDWYWTMDARTGLVLLDSYVRRPQ